MSPLRAGQCVGLAALALLIGNDTLQTATANGDTRALTLRHSHRDDEITVTFKRNGQYDEEGLKKLNHFLRDWRNDAQTRMDPHLFDVVWEVYREVGGKEAIRIISAYRSPETNAMLRRRSRGVARFSQHMLGKAMDFYIPGVALEEQRYAGLRLQRGGVGFYPSSGSPFVHIDTGSVRHWPRMAPDQLARVMSTARSTRFAAVDKTRRPAPAPAPAIEEDESETVARPVTRIPVRSAAREIKPEVKPQANAVATTPQRAAEAFALASAGSTPFPLRPAPRRAEPERAAAPETTSGITSWLQDAAPPRNDRVTPEMALAYAATATPDAARPSAQPQMMPAPRAAAAPATTQIPRTPGRPAVQAKPGQRFNDPWMRSITLTGSVHYAMSVTVYGRLDIRGVQSLMQKPAASLALTFRDDPYDGLTSFKFGGPAVAFLPTTSFSGPMRQASLR